MQITWNGTGAAWSTHYGNSSALLEADGYRFLMDCGHTAPGRLRQMGVSLEDIPAVFVSHLHGDHIYGLEEWGFRSFLIWKKKPHLFIPASLALPLWRQVLSGTMAQVCDQQCLLRDYYEVTLLHVGQPCQVGPWTLEIQPVRHVLHAPCFGLKVRQGNVAVGFTCDSLADADPFFYDDTAAVFHDCSFAPYFPDTVHAHYEQLKAYPCDYREKTYLVHYDDGTRERLEDPAFVADLKATGMRLTEPFVPMRFE